MFPLRSEEPNQGHLTQVEDGVLGRARQMIAATEAEPLLECLPHRAQLAFLAPRTWLGRDVDPTRPCWRDAKVEPLLT